MAGFYLHGGPARRRCEEDKGATPERRQMGGAVTREVQLQMRRNSGATVAQATGSGAARDRYLFDSAVVFDELLYEPEQGIVGHHPVSAKNPVRH